jgi:hypothetical protein
LLAVSSLQPSTIVEETLETGAVGSVSIFPLVFFGFIFLEETYLKK